MTPATSSHSRFGAQNPDRSLGFRRLIILLSSILLGIAAGLALLARVFVFIPTDAQRLGIILEALHDRTPRPEIVAFGNSVIMSGFDGHALKSFLPEQPVVWNCASTGQTLPEAFLLGQELPDSVRLVIYAIPIRSDAQERPLHPQRYNTLFMNGYRPEEPTLSTLSRIYGAPVTNLLKRSLISHTFASRWAVRQFVDTRVRIMLRADLTLERAKRDLFHPQGYEKAIDSRISAEFLRREIESYAENHAAIASGSAELSREIVVEANAKRRRTVFLIPPIHPDLLEAHGASILSVASAFEQMFQGASNVMAINALDLLDREHFIDDKHPTNEGARILTKFIAAELATR